ncbi:MAG TPA: helix-turn-helix transcriptional regulator [Solirubrobacteraceae bacterium]|jgi:DNA-binding XRE family transcriptional regulator
MNRTTEEIIQGVKSQHLEPWTLALAVRDVYDVAEPADPVLAGLLKRLREERGITQEQLAFAADITVSALSRIERGLNSPGWETVGRIAKALDIRLVELAADYERAGIGR